MISHDFHRHSSGFYVCVIVRLLKLNLSRFCNTKSCHCIEAMIKLKSEENSDVTVVVNDGDSSDAWVTTRGVGTWIFEEDVEVFVGCVLVVINDGHSNFLHVLVRLKSLTTLIAVKIFCVQLHA